MLPLAQRFSGVAPQALGLGLHNDRQDLGDLVAERGAQVAVRVGLERVPQRVEAGHAPPAHLLEPRVVRLFQTHELPARRLEPREVDVLGHKAV